MSSIEQTSYNFEHDLEQSSNAYPASDLQWIYINDLNSGNYSNNFINFSNMTVIGNSAEKFFDWSQAYVAVPYTVSLNATNCYFGKCATIGNGGTAPVMSSIPENAYAVGVKGYHHFLDTVYVKYNGVNVNRNTPYVNLLMNENLKKMANEEYNLMGDILCHSYDNADALLINPVDNVNGISANQYTANNMGLEVNNNTVIQPFCAGFASNYNVNQGHINRMDKVNQDLSVTNGILSNILTGATISDCYQNCYLGANAGATTLTWTGMATIPLAKICDFFDKMPSVASAQGFEFRMQTNIGGSNSYSYSFTFSANGTALNIGTVVPNSGLTGQIITANQSIGHTCPFMISSAGYLGNTGLSVYPDNTHTTGTVALTSSIGYNGSATTVPCRIWVPLINYTPSYTSMILKQPSCKILYEDFYVDQILKQRGGDQVSRLYNVQLSRPRTMYIIPFFSSTGMANTIGISPYQQCLSSCPNTSSPCRLSNLQIQIGGQNIFVEPQQYSFHFYNNQILSLMGSNYNGNSLKSRFFGGQITKSMWEKAYGVYAFNLQKVDSETTDNLMKSFQVNFKIDTPNTLYYDFMIIMTYQSVLNLDRGTGTVTSENSV